MVNDVYLSLGSNKGDRKKSINRALSLLSNRGISIVKVSSFYKSKGWGNRELNDFLNIAIHVRTEYSPQDLLKEVLEVEQSLGRIRKEFEENKHYEDRSIDIDIIFYNELILEDDDLSIPHKFFQDRNFVLLPLMELDPDYQDPRSGKSIEQLWKLSKDENIVEKLA